MKRKLFLLIPILLFVLILTPGCAAIGGIFKAGVWTGIIAVILIVGLIIFIVSKLFSKNKGG